MNNNTIYYLIALVMLSLAIIIFALGSSATAGGPWSNQYCDVEVTKIRVIDQNGEVVENLTEEKVVCNDGASDFLFDMGEAIAFGTRSKDNLDSFIFDFAGFEHQFECF